MKTFENKCHLAIVRSVPGPWSKKFTWTKASRYHCPLPRPDILLLESYVGDVGHANPFQSQNSKSRDSLFSLASAMVYAGASTTRDIECSEKVSECVKVK